MSPLLLGIALAAVYLYGFWVLYVAVMGLYRAHLAGRLVDGLKVMAYPLVALGFLVDLLCQYTLAIVLFADWPAKGEHLVTDRLQRYMLNPGTWRANVAAYVCDNLLDPLDPTGNHC